MRFHTSGTAAFPTRDTFFIRLERNGEGGGCPGTRVYIAGFAARNLLSAAGVDNVVRKSLVFAALVALCVPSAAPAKWEGDLRVCGANSCRTIERHVGHDTWPLLSALSTWPSNAGPPAPGPWYRLTIVPLDVEGRPNLAAQSLPIYFVPGARSARNDDGRGGVYWTQLPQTPERLAKAVKALRPFPAPRVTRIVVGTRVAADPQSYLRLFRLRGTGGSVADLAAPRPSEQPTVAEYVAYWKRVDRRYLSIHLSSRRETPWSDWKTSVWIGRKADVLMRDGELVRVPHGLAERIRRAQSLR
jgi:hypothetical protein